MEMVRFLQAQGFAVARIRGSHHVMEKQSARTTVPVHGSEILKIGSFEEHAHNGLASACALCGGF